MPCGKCAQCAKKVQNDWYIRIFEESKNWDSSYFFTLTYNEESVPYVTNDNGDKFNTVCRDDVQKFMKRLRKHLYLCHGDSYRIKFFLCSEYGPKTNRPHYHGIIFNITADDVHFIEESWQNGFVNVSRVRGAGSFRYVSKYCSKPSVLRYELTHPVEKTFRLMSKGLGKSYCDDSQNRAFHISDIFGHHYYFANGFKYGLPRYYCNHLFDNMQQLEYKRKRLYQETKEWRFRFTSMHKLDGVNVRLSSPFQLKQLEDYNAIIEHRSDANDLALFNKFVSKSKF